MNRVAAVLERSSTAADEAADSGLRLSLSRSRSLGRATDRFNAMRGRAEQAMSEANAVIRGRGGAQYVELEDEPAVPWLTFTLRYGSGTARLSMRPAGREGWLELSGGPLPTGSDAPVEPEDLDVMEDLIVALLIADQREGVR